MTRVSYMNGVFIPPARRSTHQALSGHAKASGSQICNVAMCLIMCSGLATWGRPLPCQAVYTSNSGTS